MEDFEARGRVLIDASFEAAASSEEPTQQSLGKLYRFLLEGIYGNQEALYYKEAIAEVGLFAVSIVCDPQGFSHGDRTRLSEIILSWDGSEEVSKDYRASSYSLYIAGDGLAITGEPRDPAEQEMNMLRELLQEMHQQGLINFH